MMNACRRPAVLALPFTQVALNLGSTSDSPLILPPKADYWWYNSDPHPVSVLIIQTREAGRRRIKPALNRLSKRGFSGLGCQLRFQCCNSLRLPFFKINVLSTLILNFGKRLITVVYLASGRERGGQVHRFEN